MAERMRELKIRRPSLSPQEAGNLIAFLYSLEFFDRPGNPEAGKRLFRQKRCIQCHQVAGVGGVVGPNLDALKEHRSPIFVAAALWNHGPAMAEEMRRQRVPRPTFSGSELLDLIAYLSSVSPRKAEGRLFVLPGVAERGRRLFSAKRCIECHGVAGKGGKVGPDLAERSVRRSLTEFAGAMWNKLPSMMAAMRARGISFPRLEAEEMADIVAYLYSVRYFAVSGDPERGQRVAAQKGCLACHARDGEASAPDLSRVKGLDAPEAVIAAMWNHSFIERERKVSWPQISAQEMADLMAFLGRLR